MTTWFSEYQNSSKTCQRCGESCQIHEWMKEQCIPGILTPKLAAFKIYDLENQTTLNQIDMIMTIMTDMCSIKPKAYAKKICELYAVCIKV